MQLAKHVRDRPEIAKFVIDDDYHASPRAGSPAPFLPRPRTRSASPLAKKFGDGTDDGPEHAFCQFGIDRQGECLGSRALALREIARLVTPRRKALLQVHRLR